MFLTRVRAESDGAGDRSPWGSFWFESAGARTAAGALVTPDRAMRLNAVFACVKVLAESFAVMPFMLWQWTGDPPRRKKRPDHWAFRRIAKAPNGFQTPFEWRMMLEGHLALRGNAFCQITANGRGEITELLPLHPDRMQVEVLKSGDYRYVYTDQFGRRITYLRSEIWHLRWMSQDGIVGLSPIELARESIGEGLEQQSYSARFYANDARPGGWIEFDGTFATKEAKKNWRESWQEMQGGRNARKVAVLEKGMKYHELSLNDADTHHVTSRLRNLRDIARIFRVPPHKIGDLEKSTNNNIEHQSIEFWTDTMLPWARLWSDSIDFFLIGPDSDEQLDAEFDIKPMMRGDGKARAERLKSLVLSGILLRNEAREEEGYDPFEGGDKPLVPLNMVTLDEDGEPEEPPGGPEDDGPVPGAPGNGAGGDPNERLMALASSAAERVARKEVEAVRRVGAERAKVLPLYERHAGFVAAALGVSEDVAAAYCAQQVALLDERPNMEGDEFEAIARSRLERLALGEKPEPVNVGAAAMHRLATAIAAMPPPVVNVDVHPAAVEVKPADVNVAVGGAEISVQPAAVENRIEVPAAQVDVHVAAPQVHNHVATPDVKVEVAAPVVEATIDVKPADVIIQEPSKGGQADRPYPTRTEIIKRDAQGRADVIETRPLDD